MLKKVAKYLQDTKTWGIIYQRTNKNESLPVCTEDKVSVNEDLPPFPVSKPLQLSAFIPLQLSAFVDAAHENDLCKHRSATGYAFMLSGGVVSYRCKTQESITATSSTEAELLAPVTAAKQARYLCAIMAELGYKQLEATPIYEDNQSAINMINARIPTERSRHIDIQFFAIQEEGMW